MIQVKKRTLSQGDVEKACVVYEKLKEDSVYTKVMYEMLVDNLKDELFRVMHNCKDDYYLEVEDIMKNIDKEFYLDVKEEYFEGLEKIVKAKEIAEVMKTKERDKIIIIERDKRLEKSKDEKEREEELESDEFVEIEEMEDSGEERESEEECEYENEDLLYRLCDG